jgi:deazaflavin-dependent oxidoreductase (nitroreductase family)
LLKSYCFENSLSKVHEIRDSVKMRHAALAPLPAAAYILPMDFKNGSTLIADLTTIGRKTGQPRTVELRLVYHNGSYYASSSRVDGKHWCQNMIKNPAVEITVNGNKLACTARQITDDKLRREILSLRDSPPRIERVVFEITPNS